MAEISRRLFRARDRENKPLSLSTKSVLTLLWTYVPTAMAKSYADGGPRPRFRRGLSVIANEIDLSVRQLRRHLELLEAAALILRNGDYFELTDDREQARLLLLDPVQPAHVNAPAVIAVTVFDGLPVIPVTPPVVTDDRSSGHSCPDSVSEMTEKLSFVSPDPLGGSGSGSRSGSECGSRVRPRGRLAHLHEIAMEIVRTAPQPSGAAPLPTTSDGVRDLIELLVGGWQREQIVEVLEAAPALIAEGLQDARWFGPEMFRGERWTRWRHAFAQLQARKPPPPPPEEVALRNEEAERAEREAAEAAELRRILGAIEQPPRPTPFDAMHPWGHSRWYLSVLFNPNEAVAVARATIAAAEAEGRPLTAAELSRALAEVDVSEALTSEPASPPAEPVAAGEHADKVLLQLQALREKAAREGRRPTLEELQGVQE